MLIISKVQTNEVPTASPTVFVSLTGVQDAEVIHESKISRTAVYPQLEFTCCREDGVQCFILSFCEVRYIVSASEWDVHLYVKLAKAYDDPASRIEQDGPQLIGWILCGAMHLAQISNRTKV